MTWGAISAFRAGEASRGAQAYLLTDYTTCRGEVRILEGLLGERLRSEWPRRLCEILGWG